MPNPKGNEATLRKFDPKWQSGSTRTIRVPIVLADQILTYAREVDQGKATEEKTVNQLDTDSLSQVIEILKEVKETPRNNFSKDKKALVQKAIDLIYSLSQVNDVN